MFLFGEQGSFSMLLFCYCFIYYRKYQPDIERPFLVPGGMAGAYITIAPIVIVTLLNMYFAITSPDTVIGIPYGKAVGCVIITAMGISFHAALIYLRKNDMICCCTDYRPLRDTMDDPDGYEEELQLLGDESSTDTDKVHKIYE